MVGARGRLAGVESWPCSGMECGASAPPITRELKLLSVGGAEAPHSTLGRLPFAMLAELKELWKFRELLVSMVQRELKIRYKNSALGFFWSLINPLVTVLVMTFVFKFIMANDTPSFSSYILAAYLPFMFFQLAIMDSAQSVLGALPLVRKIYFPREVLPLAQ